MAQTAIEWLVEKLYKEGHFYYVQQTEIIDKAKQMEKKQAFQSFKAGQDSMEEGGKNFEQYYEKTYGNKLDKK